MTKNQSFTFDTKPSNQIGKGAFSRNLFLRNEPNFISIKFTATSYTTVGYNDLQPKPKNGTKPNEANLKPIPNTLNPHFFWESPRFYYPLICKSKPNFKSLELSATSCSGYTYNDFHPQTNKKSKPNPNPIQTQFQTQSQLSTVTCLPFYYLRPPVTSKFQRRRKGPQPNLRGT